MVFVTFMSEYKRFFPPVSEQYYLSKNWIKYLHLLFGTGDESKSLLHVVHTLTGFPKQNYYSDCSCRYPALLLIIQNSSTYSNLVEYVYILSCCEAVTTRVPGGADQRFTCQYIIIYILSLFRPIINRLCL